MGQSDSMVSDRFESEKSEHEEDGKIGVVCSFCVNDFRGEEMAATCATLSVPREYDNSSGGRRRDRNSPKTPIKK